VFDLIINPIGLLKEVKFTAFIRKGTEGDGMALAGSFRHVSPWVNLVGVVYRIVLKARSYSVISRVSRAFTTPTICLRR
jgi:hypothetical protein